MEALQTTYLVEIVDEISDYLENDMNQHALELADEYGFRIFAADYGFVIRGNGFNRKVYL